MERRVSSAPVRSCLSRISLTLVKVHSTHSLPRTRTTRWRQCTGQPVGSQAALALSALLMARFNLISSRRASADSRCRSSSCTLRWAISCLWRSRHSARLRLPQRPCFPARLIRWSSDSPSRLLRVLTSDFSACCLSSISACSVMLPRLLNILTLPVRDDSPSRPSHERSDPPGMRRGVAP